MRGSCDSFRRGQDPSSWRRGALALLASAAAMLGCTHTSVLERIREVAQPPDEFDRRMETEVREAPGACGALGDLTLREHKLVL